MALTLKWRNSNSGLVESKRKVGYWRSDINLRELLHKHTQPHFTLIDLIPQLDDMSFGCFGVKNDYYKTLSVQNHF